MTLVGDLIMNVRSLGPDPSQTLSAPSIQGAATPVGGGNFGAGTVFYVATISNEWGESLPSAEGSVLLLANQGFTLTIQGIATGVQPGFGNYSINVYFSNVSGGENTYQTFPVGQATNTVVTVLSQNVYPGSPPVRSSAFLPDSDGGFVSTKTMYRWLNDALRAASRIAGGIQDACGVASTSGNRRYIVGGQWLKFDQCFYDGWELDLGNKAETFRNRNLTANISLSLMVDAQSETTRIELYWTPSRTSGTATTTGPITVSATTIPITGVARWLLQDGYALLFDGINTEVVSYSAQTGSSLTGVIRGWSGTQPFAFLTGATVTELNVELNGYRMPYFYSAGQASTILGVPPGWEPFLKDYLLGTFRKAEQETQEGEQLQQSAAKALMEWVKSSRQVAGPRQTRMYGDYGLRGTVPGGITGPIIIP